MLGVPDLPRQLSSGDSREVRELKQIVNGMREELREYLANGNGTPRSYWRRLLERTQQEMQIYERIRRELENEKNPAVWEEKNEALRRLGLRTIVDGAGGNWREKYELAKRLRTDNPNLGTVWLDDYFTPQTLSRPEGGRGSGTPSKTRLN